MCFPLFFGAECFFSGNVAFSGSSSGRVIKTDPVGKIGHRILHTSEAEK